MEIFGTARIMRARHGNIWHGTDPPDPGTARHGTSLRSAHQTSSYSRVAVERSDGRDPKTLAEAPHGKNCLKWHIEKWPPIFLEAPNLWVRCRRRFLFSEKWPPYFWKPLTCGYVAAGTFFSFRKIVPIFLEAPNQEIRRVPLPGVSRSEV